MKPDPGHGSTSLSGHPLMIQRETIEHYVLTAFPDARLLEFRALGSGAHGTGYCLKLDTPEGTHDYVIKILAPRGLGHDYPSDRAAVFLLAHAEYGNLPNHVRAIDVISQMPDGSWKSVGGGKEYYLIMERAVGTTYFADLALFRNKQSLEQEDIRKIMSMTEYLARIHAVKKQRKALYWRKLRDIIGHGECLMGVFDTYPEGVLDYREMAAIEKKCVDWRARLKPFHHRLSQIHGDFHPGNIWFHDSTFTLLDRSRGPFGEPADDVTALTINYIFFSIQYFNDIRSPFIDAFRLFFTDYLRRTGDREILEVCGLFYAFRGAVIANPVFYPEVTGEQRKLIFSFVRNVLEDTLFDFEGVNRYLEG
ncbi:MAG: phosphotransferase family protein [bacterium]